LKTTYLQRKYFLIPIMMFLSVLICILMFTINIPALNADGSTLIASYGFDGTLSDSLGGSTLTAFGTENDGNDHNNATSGFGTDGGIGGDTSYWYWTSTLVNGGGFYIDVDSAISTNYSIGVRFAFNETGPSWKKIIDYKNMSRDTGFYFNSGNLLFYNYPLGSTPTTISNGQIVDVIATRDSSSVPHRFIAYMVVDGKLLEELNVDDTGGQAIPSVIGGKPRLGFFFDDIATPTEATSGGKVYSIKIWNGPITQKEAGNAMDDATENGNITEVLANTPAYIPVRTHPMTCRQVWINKKNNFEFIFWWEYASNNIVRIYDMDNNPVFEKNFEYGQPNFEAELPDGFYTVKTFHDSDLPIQTFLIGKP
jgi:hypothetical protein